MKSVTRKTLVLTKADLIKAMAELPDDARVFIDSPRALFDVLAYIVEDQGPKGPPFLVLEAGR